ncbi:hypothetical protein Syun_007572 [Stephania yunnanensis]|uniref:Uncharacterized protein n=1 Tax=Stephania yunnanensis TaxID=152371 RepID=A0AAP0Q2I2_9MAGN
MAGCESSSSMMKSAASSVATAEAAEAAVAVVDHHEEEDDACSICLEAFSSQDPATVNRFHFDPPPIRICSQQLLEAVEIERNLRSRQRERSANAIRFAHIPPEEFEFDTVAPSEDESELDEHIMQQLAAAAFGRAHHLNRRQRHRSSRLDPSQVHVFATPPHGSSAEQIFTNASTEGLIVGNTSPNSPSSTIATERYNQLPSSARPSLANMLVSGIQNCSSIKRSLSSLDTFERGLTSQTPPRSPARQTPQRSPRRSRPSELSCFSETIKSKFSAASARYKESISKGTRGFKEKLLARNNSVKELSKEVHREVTAGVARMMERLDPASRRTGSSSSVSGCAEGTSSIPCDPKNLQDSLLVRFPSRIHSDASCGTHPNPSIHGCGTASSVPDRVEVTRLQSIFDEPWIVAKMDDLGHNGQSTQNSSQMQS